MPICAQEIHWDARVESLITRDDGAIGGVRWATVHPPTAQEGSTVKSSVQEIHADAVVLAAGHSASEPHTATSLTPHPQPSPLLLVTLSLHL